ncbi:MAG: 2'-5' RNA ligase family protein, partial [Lachnospiraceae bacterium]|nr:2'-5' RNA ligase family protein [Lachnospiraceae bacterium]
MYLITAYFDDKTSNILMRHIKNVANATNNNYMIDNNVPPHLTVCALEAINVEYLVEGFDRFSSNQTSGEVFIASLGQFLPYVLYCAPVPNKYLMDMSKMLSDIYENVEKVSINKFYQAGNWLPHITLAKKLELSEMQSAVAVMQNSFVPIKGRIVRLGLSKVNPHVDVKV